MTVDPTGLGLPVRSVESLDDIGDITDIWFPQADEKTDGGPSELDVAAEKAREAILQNAPRFVQELERRGVVGPGNGKFVVAQAANIKRKRTLAVKQSVAGQTMPVWTADQDFSNVPSSRQINMEDFFTSLDFIPLPRNIRMELYEQEMFEENHITGTCVDLLANAITKRGWEFARYDADDGGLIDSDTNDDEAEDDEEDDGTDEQELSALEDWLDNLNSVTDFRQIVEHTGAAFKVTGNAYIEIIREDIADPSSPPAGMETFISSSVRILRGHRGFVQWLAGEFRWFNVYMPNEEDRTEGMQLWAQYWADRGVDVTSEDFINSSLSRTLNSTMPIGVWNPYLTEVMHFKELSLTSKYYGFPRDYRLGKLNALLQWSLDYNIALQKNQRIPPAMILFHGKLSPEHKQDIKQYFESIRGADNYGKLPILEAPASPGGPAGGGPKAGLEIVQLTQPDKDGMFLNLWERVIKDIAMHYGIPLDLLTTENSNRATVIEAEESFNDRVVGRFHMIFEDKFKRITKYDLGFVNRYVRFIDMDTDDSMAKAQEAQIWHNIGVLNANEIRGTYLALPERPGGDTYWEGVMIEDQVGEEDSNAQAKAEMEKSPAQKIAAALKTAAEQMGGAPAEQPPANENNDSGNSGDQSTGNQGTTQSAAPTDLWDYLTSRYG